MAGLTGSRTVGSTVGVVCGGVVTIGKGSGVLGTCGVTEVDAVLVFGGFAAV